MRHTLGASLNIRHNLFFFFLNTPPPPKFSPFPPPAPLPFYGRGTRLGDGAAGNLSNEGRPARPPRRSRSCPSCAPQDQTESVLGRDLQPDRDPARCRRAVSAAGYPAQAGVGGARDEREHGARHGECATASPVAWSGWPC